MSAAPSVAVVAVGDGIDTTAIIDRLQRVGITATGDHHAATLLVALTDDHLRPGLAALNTAALAINRPWLLARPGGRQLWLGPLLRPGHGACWTCLAERLRTNRAVSRPRATDSVPPPLDTAPAVTADGAATVIALEVVKVVEGAPSAVDDAIVTLDTPDNVNPVLPAKPDELSDEELDAAAGGAAYIVPCWCHS